MTREDLSQTLLARGYRFDTDAAKMDDLRSTLRQHLTLTKGWTAQDVIHHWASFWMYSALSSSPASTLQSPSGPAATPRPSSLIVITAAPPA